MSGQSEMNDPWLNGLLEIFGDGVVQNWLGQTGGSDTRSLRTVAEREIGVLEVRGMFIRAGRASFYYWMKQNAQKLGWRSPEFRLLPASAKADRALNDFLTEGADRGLFDFAIENHESLVRFTFTGKAGASALLDGNMLVGVIQELQGWANGGKYYRVEEIEPVGEIFSRILLVLHKKPVV